MPLQGHGCKQKRIVLIYHCFREIFVSGDYLLKCACYIRKLESCIDRFYYLVNAADNKQRDTKMNKIKINIDV